MKKNETTTSSLAPFFEKIEGLTKPQRIAIYAGTLVLIIGLSVYLLFYPKWDEIEGLKNQLATVQTELAKAKKNAAELNDWRTKMKKKEAQYKTVMRALPEKEEIPSLLAGISQAGQDAGLEFLLFKPQGEVAKDFYAEIPVDIVVSGSYHQVALFFDKVANLPRIVNIRKINISPAKADKGGNRILKTDCQAVTYQFIESSGGGNKGKKGKKGRGRK